MLLEKAEDEEEGQLGWARHSGEGVWPEWAEGGTAKYRRGSE